MRFVFYLEWCRVNERSFSETMQSELMSSKTKRQLSEFHNVFYQLVIMENKSDFDKINKSVDSCTTQFYQDEIRRLSQQRASHSTTRAFTNGNMKTSCFDLKPGFFFASNPLAGYFSKQLFKLDVNLKLILSGDSEHIRVCRLNSQCQVDSKVIFDINYKDTRWSKVFQKDSRALVVQRLVRRDYDLAINFVHSHLIAKYFAQLFNEATLGEYSVRVDKVFLALTDELTPSPESEVLFAIETGLETRCLIDKYYCQPASEVLDAFTHFTYERSHHRLMVLSIKTIKSIDDSNSVTIFEPVIFSKFTLNCSLANLGTYGMEHFMNKHKCNYVCRMSGCSDRVFRLS